MVKKQLQKILMILNKLVEYGDLRTETDLINTVSDLINSIDYLYSKDCIYESDCLKLADNEKKDCNNCLYGYNCSLEFKLVDRLNIGLPIGYISDLIYEILVTEYSETDLKYLDMYKLLDLFCITDRLDLLENITALDSLVSENNISMQTVFNKGLCKYLVDFGLSDTIESYFETYYRLKDSPVSADCFISYNQYEVILTGDDISSFEVITDVNSRIKETTENILCFYETDYILRCLE